MVRLTRIYTRGGDKGTTSLGDGTRVAKHHPRVAAYGTVDETNAVIGEAQVELARAIEKLSADAKAATPGSETQERLRDRVLAAELAAEFLTRVQNDLLDLGADLCTPEAENPKYPPLRIVAAQVERLEREIDQLNAELEPLNSFVLPGGTDAAAKLHSARTVARRAEREITRFAEEEPVNAEAVRYINRLSDLLFVLARYVNDKGRMDLLWTPGEHR